MKSWFNLYLTQEFLLGVAVDGKYEVMYLILPLMILFVIFGFRVYIFFKKNRPTYFREFDSWFFWGTLLFSLIGLFIYFSRTQELPTFSSRLFSYFWIFCIFIYYGFLVVYWLIKIPKLKKRYYEAKRKSKYFK